MSLYGTKQYGSDRSFFYEDWRTWIDAATPQDLKRQLRNTRRRLERWSFPMRGQTSRSREENQDRMQWVIEQCERALGEHNLPYVRHADLPAR